MKKSAAYFCLISLCAVMPATALATDLAVSGFGTVGYAVSDQSYIYQRSIDHRGTFLRDSVLGLQADVKFNPHWGATFQTKLAQAPDSDTSARLGLAWAFGSWRPNDEWLIRVGKLRVPLMINTENQDVNLTHPYARLPEEVYATAPTTDIWGGMISKSWLVQDWDFNLDGYYGKINYYQRFYGRLRTSDNPQQGGSWYLPTDIRAGGLVLTARDINRVFRIGVHDVRTQSKNGTIPVGSTLLPVNSLVPTLANLPLGDFYSAQGGPEVKTARSPVFFMGGSVALPYDMRLSGEYVRVQMKRLQNGWNRWAMSGALSKRIGAWTPYVSYAKLKSSASVLHLYDQVSSHSPSPLLQMPGLEQLASGVQAGQTLAADAMMAHDQSTLAVGTSFAMQPNHVIELEWAQTRTGRVSSFIDAPAGGSSARQRVNVYSISYNFTF